jgi:mannose-6-phosphate isomerase-like protein (cupin superfamily)
MKKGSKFTPGIRSFIGLLIMLSGVGSVFNLPAARGEDTPESANQKSPIIGSDVETDDDRHQKLETGARFLYPCSNQTVDVESAKIQVKKKSAVLMTNMKNVVSLYVLTSKGPNKIVLGDQTLIVQPGHCVVIGPNESENFDSTNPAWFVGYRYVHELPVKQPYKVYEAEFSTASLIAGLKKVQTETNPELSRALATMAKKQSSKATGEPDFQMYVPESVRKKQFGK